MKKFIIERTIPNAGQLTGEELSAISATSCETVNGLNKPYHWIQTFVTDDKMYCVHIAPDRETILEHSNNAGFPVDRIVEVRDIIDPTTSNKF